METKLLSYKMELEMIGGKDFSYTNKRFNEQAMPEKHEFTELVKTLATAGIIGVVSASIKALMTYKKDVNVPELIRTFFAGVLLSILVGYFLLFSNISELWKSLIIASSSAFISTFWPLLEKLAKSYFSKKTKDVLSDTDMD